VLVQAHGDTWFPLTGDPLETRLQQTAHALCLPWHWRPVPELTQRRWLKLLQNSVINPLSALAGVPNGQLPRHPVWSLAQPLIDEAIRVARAFGQTLDGQVALTQVTHLADQTQANWSSMLQDVRRRQATEIQAINGYIVRKARVLNLPAPTHAAVVHLIETMSKSSADLLTMIEPYSQRE
jgi:2-dehydropantoate 2-reductase